MPRAKDTRTDMRAGIRDKSERERRPVLLTAHLFLVVMVELIKFYDYHHFGKCTIKTCKHKKIKKN
jgi:hypothetical protein